MSRSTHHRMLVLATGVSLSVALSACGGGSLGGTEGADGQAAGGGTSAVKVGLLLPTSGVFAPLGSDMRQGFDLYLSEHQGKLAGRDVKLTAVDEGDTPDTGVPAAQGLLEQDVDAVVGVVNSATALGVRDAFEEAQIPLIVTNAGADAITGARKSDYVWRTSFANGAVSGALGPHVAEQCESVHVITSDIAAGKEHGAGFEKALKAAGGSVAGNTAVPLGTTNFQPFLAQVTAGRAECAFAFFAGSDAVAFTQQYAQFGLKDDVQLYAPGFLTEGGVLKAAGEAATGVETSLHYSDQLDSQANRTFVEAYTAAYDKPPTVYAVQAYDAASVLDTALASGTDGPAVVRALQGITSVESPRGTWTFDEGHGPQQPYYLRRVAKGPAGLVNEVVEPLEP